jgi:hypothetical protein
MEFIARLAANFVHWDFRMVRTTHAHTQTNYYVSQCNHRNQINADISQNRFTNCFSTCYDVQYHIMPVYSAGDTCTIMICFISNNSSIGLKDPGVPSGSDGSNVTSYPLTQNDTLSFSQATVRFAYLPPVLCARNVVTYMHHQKDTYVTLFTGIAVMQ